MPWKEMTTMELREEFVGFAKQEGANIRELCRHYGITPRTGYKWLRRYEEQGKDGLTDRSRRPHYSPKRTASEIEALVIGARDEYPSWGGRKIKTYLEQDGHKDIPSPSTITAILKRYDKVDEEESQKHRPFQRFEKETPNEMSQIDFKGDFPIGKQDCYTLAILDDHSRYLLGLFACKNQQIATVRDHLIDVFRQYGLPDSILCDNGPPWGSIQYNSSRFTRLNIWWIRLGIRIIHSRPYHPQTLGKVERLHRTLNSDLLTAKSFSSFSSCQQAYDAWRDVYNHRRPHEALSMDTPSEHYRKSNKPFPEMLSPVEYDMNMWVRKVSVGGSIQFKGKRVRVGRAFTGQYVGIAADELEDGIFQVYFCQQQISMINLKSQVKS